MSNRHKTNTKQLKKRSGFANGGIISYFYNAMRQKVKKVVLENAVTTTTDYLTGYQYKNESLQFFPHSEGYVNFTQASKGAVPTDTFNYAFNYVDHLGNVRLTYSQDPLTLALRIMEENHYYPFGLKHSGYNSDQLMYIKQGTTTKIVPVPPLFKTSYDVKFQGQKREEDLELNWDSFKWRNYDYAIGRFHSVDPLSEQYAYNSTYAIQENKMGMGRELEGLELVPWLELMLSSSDAVKISTEVTSKAEWFSKTTETTSRFSETQLKDFARGNASEAEQLAKNGLEKNTKPYEAVDPKTGKTGKTIPDSFGKDGETVEVKDVKYQPETSQLRLQGIISNSRGTIPRLIINEAAKLSKNLKNGNYKIDIYNFVPPVVIDKTNTKKPEPSKTAPKPKPDPNMV